MQQGREFDAVYNSQLSDDAIPALIEAMPTMPVEDRCEVGSAIHYSYRELGQSFDLRSYNVGRRIAYSRLLANETLLHDTAQCPSHLSNDRDPATYGDGPAVTPE